MKECYVFEPGKEPVVFERFHSLFVYPANTYRYFGEEWWCIDPDIGIQFVEVGDVPPEIRLKLLLLQ